MTGRISSNGYTILKAMDKPMRFDRAVEFNQIMFYALIRRGFIKLTLANESFSRTKDGDQIVELYENGNPEDLTVKSNPPARELRVADKLGGKVAKKKPAKSIKTTTAAAA